MQGSREHLEEGLTYQFACINDTAKTEGIRSKVEGKSPVANHMINRGLNRNWQQEPIKPKKNEREPRETRRGQINGGG